MGSSAKMISGLAARAHLPGSSANETTPPAPAGHVARAQILRVAPGMTADYEAMTVKSSSRPAAPT